MLTLDSQTDPVTSNFDKLKHTTLPSFTCVKDRSNRGKPISLTSKENGLILVLDDIENSKTST